MLIHLLIIIKNNLRANLLLMAGMFVIATSLWYAVDYVYAVAVNGQKVDALDHQIIDAERRFGRFTLLRRGKKNYALVSWR